MPTGQITKSFKRKNFGFISSENTDEEIYFHFEDVVLSDVNDDVDDVVPNQPVEFDLKTTDLGARAYTIRLL